MNLILEFDTDEVEFRRGVEVGRIWEGLKHGETEFQVHSDIIEMILRIADSCGMIARSEDVNEDWVVVRFE